MKSARTLVKVYVVVALLPPGLPEGVLDDPVLAALFVLPEPRQQHGVVQLPHLQAQVRGVDAANVELHLQSIQATAIGPRDNRASLSLVLLFSQVAAS
eukprot:CAMPEP_0113947002 /NCGR_PEP_ID=MMETSP1339-20121228/61514_1 /TAXON_ID=94617 /ORGANISM="Fibrocapsa japonica" /LENGTH=97 /DNA_ID=CAMNT_0000953339 /DNA_START=114 /DNA_END=404 /DNA_ORIENTATION=- /assembly_acc=CAM_ASM_000762